MSASILINSLSSIGTCRSGKNKPFRGSCALVFRHHQLSCVDRLRKTGLYAHPKPAMHQDKEVVGDRSIPRPGEGSLGFNLSMYKLVVVTVKDYIVYCCR